MAKNKNFEELAKRILEEIGGKENVMHVAHCATRLRFNLKDESIPSDEKLKELSGVIGVMHAGGQLQVIIGQDVSKLYDEVCKSGNFGSDIKLNSTSEKEKKKITLKSIFNGILDGLSGSLVPAIPVITASAFFKTIISIFGPSMLGILPETSDLYVLCNFVGDAGFYFFPVILGYTAAKKFNVTPVLGILLGGIMLHPNFISLVGSDFTVFGIPSSVQNYANSLLPIIMSVWVMSYVEKFFNEHIPSVLKIVCAPALTISVMLPITLCVLGPAGAFIGNYIVAGIFSLEGVAGFLGIAVIGAVYQFLVMSGMHMILIAALFQVFATAGYDNFASPGLIASSFAVAGMCLGATLRIREKEQKALSFSYFVSSIIGGLTEPGIYGLGIRYKRPFIGLMVGGFAGGMYAGIFGAAATTLLPVSNFLAAFMYTGSTTTNLVHGVISCIIAFVVAAVVTYIFGFKKDDSALVKASEA